MIDHHDNDTSGDWMIWFFSLHELLHTWLANLQRLYMFSDYGYKVNFVIEDTMSGSLWQASIVCICLHYILASMTDKFKRCMNEYPKLAQVSSPERHYKLYLLNSENILWSYVCDSRPEEVDMTEQVCTVGFCSDGRVRVVCVNHQQIR